METLMKRMFRNPMQARNVQKFTSSKASNALEGDEQHGMKSENSEGVSFSAKYLGSTLVDEPRGEHVCSEAMKRILCTAKARPQAVRRVSVVVLPLGVKVFSSDDDEALVCDMSIHRISHCALNSSHAHVVTIISRNNDNETLECHAFIFPKTKVAQIVCLTVAQSFQQAFEKEKVEKQHLHNMKRFQDVKMSSTASCSGMPSQTKEVDLMVLEDEEENGAHVDSLNVEELLHRVYPNNSTNNNPLFSTPVSIHPNNETHRHKTSFPVNFDEDLHSGELSLHESCEQEHGFSRFVESRAHKNSECCSGSTTTTNSELDSFMSVSTSSHSSSHEDLGASL